MATRNNMKWCMKGEIQEACESCKFPCHNGPCGTSSSFQYQDKIVSLNMGCKFCMEEFKEFSQSKRTSFKNSFPVELTFEELKPLFHKLDTHHFENICLFKGLNYNEIIERFHFSKICKSPSLDEDKFKRRLRDSILNMSPSGQQVWKTMFGNVEESIQLLWSLNCDISFHIFSHQMAYFLSTIDSQNKTSFLSGGSIGYIIFNTDLQDLYMLLPCIGLDNVNLFSLLDYGKDMLTAALLLFMVKNQKELEKEGIFDKDQVGELACKYGVPYVYVNSHPSMFSLDAFCPLGIMEMNKLNKSPSFIQEQRVRASAQLVHKIEVYPQNIEVNINIRNVRCHVLCSENEKYFPSRIQIRVMPSKDCKMRTQSLTIGRSSNDSPRTLNKEEEWEGGIQFPKGPVELKKGMKFGSSSTHTNWRFEMNECLDNSSAGYFDWTLFDNANGVEVWNADSKNYKKLMDRRSSLRKRGSHMNSPFNREGGCVFSEDLYGQPLTWSFDRRFEGTTSSWTVEMDVWLTYCYNVSHNNCFGTASWSFTESLEMKTYQAFH